jgi:2-keto-4-pentenoate hydratase/2-oxohepta-3-ene-1,7-dioic acid hydratase in catechol pathway
VSELARPCPASLGFSRCLSDLAAGIRQRLTTRTSDLVGDPVTSGSNTNDMIWNCRQMISSASRMMTI